MAEPSVSINGHKAGYWAYGYNAFRIDITPYIKTGDNLLEVDLKNVEESSRWYPGAGIYRPVKLVITPKSHIDMWQTCVQTLSIQENKALIRVSAKVENPLEGQEVFISLTDRDGQIVKTSWVKVPPHGDLASTIEVEGPSLWTPETPYLYTLSLNLVREDVDETAGTADVVTIDETRLRFGIRTVSVSEEGGFQLNGATRKIKGVCLHHDLGPLGTAVNKSALIRQIKTMKEMGCDAIRTSHNMPSQMQMDICDSLGMMVMAESFDMWLYPKC